MGGYGTGLGAAAAGGYAIGQLLNKTEFIQNLQNSAVDYAMRLEFGPDYQNHLKIPQVEVSGPWALEVDPSGAVDHYQFFALDGSESSAILYDTPIDLINSGVAFDPECNIFVLMMIP